MRNARIGDALVLVVVLGCAPAVDPDDDAAATTDADPLAACESDPDGNACKDAYAMRCASLQDDAACVGEADFDIPLDPHATSGRTLGA